jgi:hypothetical protein
MPERKTNGQIFGVRNNEIFLFSQPRPVRAPIPSRAGPRTIVERVLTAFQPSYFPLERSNEVFSWDPV